MTRYDQDITAGALGLSGTFWLRHADSATRMALSGIATSLKAGGVYQPIEAVETYAGSRVAMVFDTTFLFVDGDFSVLGYDLMAFSHAEVGASISGYRDITNPGRSGTGISWSGQLNRLPPIEASLSAGHDWCVMPCPADLIPTVMAAGDTVLVRGVDFLSWPGVVAMRDNPAELWNNGVAVVRSGMRLLEDRSAYVQSADRDRRSTAWVVEYMRMSQSLPAFRRAAAEYCGMFVVPCDDLLLSTRTTDEGTVYVFAQTGQILIPYTHNPLSVGSLYHRGYVVTGLFDMFVPDWDVDKFDAPLLTDDPIHLPGADGTVFSLDGVVPVKGLIWDSGQPVDVTAGAVSPVTGVPYGVWVFGGDAGALTDLNAVQATREDATGRSMYDEYGTLPVMLDFGMLLSKSLGNTLVACVTDLPPGHMYDLLKEFLLAQHPVGCTVVISEPVPEGD